MKNNILLLGIISVLTTLPAYAQEKISDPENDLQLYRTYFLNKFPALTLQDFANGVYAIDSFSKENWTAIEAFPPYVPMIDEGEKMWLTPFRNGKTYLDCFSDGPAQRKNYPYWDKKAGVITLPMAINKCRIKYGEKMLDYTKGPITNLLAYMSDQSRGQTINVKIPDQKALDSYNKGKAFYFTRRGQLNFSCAHCHFESAGKRIRSDFISPALGHTSNWPTYRSEWGELGTLHRLFMSCNKLVRARWFTPQGEQYRNLEYFMSHMNNGIEYNGPSSRR